MASRNPADLIEPFQSAILELIKRAKEAGIPAFITDTTRSQAEQNQLVAEGKSWTYHSKHLIGEAADIAFQPNGVLSYEAKYYDQLYEIAKDIPYVIWPYRDLGWNIDKPHFQFDPHKLTTTMPALEQLKIRVEQLKEQVRRLHAEVKKLTDEVLQYKTRWEKEKRGHEQTIEREVATYTEWQKSIEESKRWERKYNAARNKQLQGLNALEKLQEIRRIIGI